jgi:hypothetical protein
MRWAASIRKNYVREAIGKIATLSALDGIEWH